MPACMHVLHMCRCVCVCIDTHVLIMSGITPNHSSTLFNEAGSLKPGAHGDGHLTNQLALGVHGPCLLSAGITDWLPHPPDT